MHSVWQQEVERSEFAPLQESIRADVLIIGGGLAGVLCAYQLRRAGVDCVLVEADRICNGITGSTTAKLALQHGLCYHGFLKRFGEKRTRLYLEAQKAAMAEYARLCAEYPCDYEKKDSYVYSVDGVGELKREAEVLKRLGEDAELTETPFLPMETAGAVRLKDQAQFHPLKFVNAIAKELPIYEHTKAVELMPQRVITTGGEIFCDRIIVATHFPMLNKHGSYFLKLYQHRSYVLALRGAADVRGIYVDGSGKGFSFRNYGDLLLLGGGAHRTGKQGSGWSELELLTQKYYPQAKIVGRWATQDCMTLDGMPYIGQYSARTPDLYVTTGFNKWGMTSAMVSAMLLADLVQGKRNRYAAVFSPSRGMLHPQLAVNAFESVKGLLTPTVPRCPHLGCALKYNPQEHSWDCPCHGSRFREDGELINGPATDDQKRNRK